MSVICGLWSKKVKNTQTAIIATLEMLRKITYFVFINSMIESTSNLVLISAQYYKICFCIKNPKSDRWYEAICKIIVIFLSGTDVVFSIFSKSMCKKSPFVSAQYYIGFFFVWRMEIWNRQSRTIILWKRMIWF